MIDLSEMGEGGARSRLLAAPFAAAIVGDAGSECNLSIGLF